MLRYTNYNIVFQEVPNEVTLAINISNCPNRCKGCHSAYLMDDIGDELNETALSQLLEKYANAITCVCFMGGDANPKRINELAIFIRQQTKRRLKVAWYSGKTDFSDKCELANFDYVKLGPYIEALGGLESQQGNQRFYQIEAGKMVDQTKWFRK